MNITSFGLSDIGQKRKLNEDFYIINDKISLYLVADGMGGHSGGDFASKIGSLALEEFLLNAITRSPNIYSTTSPANYNELLMDAFNFASNKVFNYAKENPILKGMGTTIASLLIKDNSLFVSHVGDSRAYLLRNDDFTLLTIDHSLVFDKVRAKEITRDEAERHPMKNVITRSVGVQSTVTPDILQMDLIPNDSILICTDGLSNFVREDEMKKFLSVSDLSLSVIKLVDLANWRGGDDNITCVVIKISNYPINF